MKNAKKVIALLLMLCMVLVAAACADTTEDPTADADVSADASADVSADASVDASADASAPVATETGLLTDGKLVVGMECAYAPYNWTQTDDSYGAIPIAGTDNYAYGYDVSIAKYLAEKMDCEVEIKAIEWGGLSLALQSGELDCVIAGESITSERLETVDFTTPYYYATIVCLVRADSAYADAKGLADLTGASATSQLNTIWYDNCLPQIPDVNALAAMEGATNMIVAVNAGGVDVVVTDKPTALAAVAAHPDLVMLDFAGSDDDFEVSDEDINIGISVRKGNTVLLDALNAGLATLTVEDFETMMDAAIAVQPLAEE